MADFKDLSDKELLEQIVGETAKQYGVDPIFAYHVFEHESGFKPTAVSNKGASGLGQLMPSTARQMGVDPRDPIQNVDGSIRYLKQQLDRFQDPELALRAYNAGPERVQQS